jgi:hypothetical protein
MRLHLIEELEPLPVNDNDPRQLELHIPSPPRPWSAEAFERTMRRQALAIHATLAVAALVGTLLVYLALTPTTVFGGH